MKPTYSKDIAIATTTFYNPETLTADKIRAELALRTIKAAGDLGYEVVVVDGGSPQALLDDFQGYGAIVFKESSRGMGNSRRQTIMEACNLGRQVIVWAEPEKAAFIPRILTCAMPILSGKADLVIPNRKSLASYPTSQQAAENFGNSAFREMTGCNLDVWFGPRLFTREIAADYFLKYDDEYGGLWDSTFIPIMQAVKDGKRVVGVEIDYEHPQEQTKIEEGNVKFTLKRLNQLENLIRAFEKFWT